MEYKTYTNKIEEKKVKDMEIDIDKIVKFVKEYLKIGDNATVVKYAQNGTAIIK